MIKTELIDKSEIPKRAGGRGSGKESNWKPIIDELIGSGREAIKISCDNSKVATNKYFSLTNYIRRHEYPLFCCRRRNELYIIRKDN